MGHEHRFTISRGVASDCGPLFRVFREILSELPYYNAWAKRDELAKYRPALLKRKLGREGYVLYLARDTDDRVVGFAIAHDDDGITWIDWFGVERRARHLGVGSGLISSIISSARRRGHHKVWCDCRTTNLPSIRTLGGNGFRRVVTLRRHWYGQDFILWQRWV